MRRIVRSFYYALRGILFTLRHERNFQIECLIGGTAVLFGLFIPLSRLEFAIGLLALGVILGLELVNTALERVMDILKPRVHPYARVVKDVMAGAVTIAAVTGAMVGLIIFWPYIFA